MVSGVHLIGSIPLPDSASTFEYVAKSLPEGTVKSIPDGETGARFFFVQWNRRFFPENVLMNTIQPDGWHSFSDQEVAQVMSKFPGVDSQYDVEAIKSYKVFKELRDQGVIPKGVKFQACIPTPDNFIGSNIEPDLQAPIAPLYEQALIENIKNIQKAIAHAQLAIQLDMAADFCILHGQWYPMILGPIKYIDQKAGKDVLMPMLVDKIVRMAQAVEEDVEFGLHLCYGDAGKKHFIEPPDTTMLSEYLLQILAKLTRPLNFVHFPVPKNRLDEAYLEPFRDIVLAKLDPRTEIYVGLVHANELEGTLKRIKVAKKVLGRDFGIATECGIGRRDGKELDAIFDVKRSVLGESKTML